MAARKVGVLTFHRSINYGSYWQARCLVEGLRARGLAAELLDHRSRRVEWREARNAFQPTLPVRTDPGHFAALGRKTRALIAAVDALPLSPAFPLEDPAQSPHYDTVVVGSDEVWNFRHPWYSGASIFFGDGLHADRLVSYAASVGNHDAADGIDTAWLNRLRRFHAISVRDENSRALLADLSAERAEQSRATGEERSAPGMSLDDARHERTGVPLVLDPCLQFPEIIPDAATPAGERYAIVYGHSFPAWFTTQLRRWADRTGTRLVTLGYPSAIADDARIDASPADFSALIAGAAAVATNFFHGCVFAIRHNRPFVCAASPYRRNKVQDLTRILGLEDHLVSEGLSDAAFADRLAALPPGLADRLAAARAASTRFLDHALA
ncbi:polysaccharide pyruvyl transferase family protein [Sphingomonas mucosissima]|uniref:Polysaccharide pyruvyl transferase n=1 Tax=Sphingomonas mucosissima TaxID=370959 RepID=A0A245ZMB9_9SPHN|nr:polysaccharide pyruvyl transferase family protein [Sphingomonas mucosissima]OWK30890.1 polysaccharide pyruvyl transferase [Sphingomonas mucosissima]